jgi:beta-N-acetylhexosaminidase
VELNAFISGCAGLALTDSERSLFARTRPCGFILFARNCKDPIQVRSLVSSFKDSVGSSDVLVLIDQEGGRVQRLRRPYWREMPPAGRYGVAYERDPERAKLAAFAGARLIAQELYDLGINVNCAPVLDVPQAGAHEIIGDRAFSTDPDVVIALGGAVIEGTLAGGVLPVIKHVPGHGRAYADSHLDLPRIEASREVLEAVDFLPFQALSDAPLAMTAHVVLEAFDDLRPATISPVIITEVIRKLIGLKGLVMSDDLGMKALRGPFSERASVVIDAGCDVALHCSGDFAEMERVASAVPPLRGEALARFKRARGFFRTPEPFDTEAALALVTEMTEIPVASASNGMELA